jgi:hypothetical protein
MVEVKPFQQINDDVALRLAVVARSTGTDLAGVLRVLRSQKPLNGIQCATLLQGLQHAATIWIGHARMGVQGNLQTNNQVARDCANEVQSWLDARSLVGEKEVPLLDAPEAILQRIRLCVDCILRDCTTE